ncbi:MAG TPA: hypothetical protein VEY10_12250 [Flavisolibacter sp.]|jgi:hypothetical protein|nr:hypothetical protein [Flavisolibacter sp.]
MKQKSKRLLLVLASTAFIHVSHAQLRFPSAGNTDVRNALERVIDDFPKQFTNLKGEVLNTNPQTVEYTSLLSFKSAQNNTITEYSGKHPVYSWQALMFMTDEFEVAAKKYKLLYNQLKGINLKLNRDYDYSLSGDYDAPDESKKFSTTVFRLSPNASNLPKVKVELSMQYELLEWKIYLLVYQKEKEDNERGKIEE